MAAERAIDVLIRFSRLASEKRTAAEILPLVADAIVDHAGGDAVAIYEIGEGGAVVLAASRNLPPDIASRVAEQDAIGEELGTELLAACGGVFDHAQALPLVSGGGLFGAAVLLFAAPKSLDGQRLELARGVVDLAAVALENAARVGQLVRSNAELRASQETLARTEKLRALGQMAAGVSHDLKNILNPLSLHLQLIQRAAAKNDAAQVKESVAEMQQALRRGLETIERLRDFSRQAPEARFELVDLNRLAHEAAAIAKPRMASRKGTPCFIHEEPGTPPTVMARGGEVVSAVVNLVVNAIDAMPAGGTITVRTGASNAGAFIQVADDGPGMSPEVQERVFEPFFTTKGTEGTGLGLAMVYACMRRHGGTVSLESALGKGATFTLWFPTAAHA